MRMLTGPQCAQLGPVSHTTGWRILLIVFVVAGLCISRSLSWLFFLLRLSGRSCCVLTFAVSCDDVFCASAANINSFFFSQVLRFEQSTCTVTAVETRDRTTCSCDANRGDGVNEGCTSWYPCFMVQVTYTTANGTTERANIYENEEVLLQGGCTFTTFCSRSSSANEESIREKLRKRGRIGTAHTCYYNPRHPEAIMDKDFSLSAVVHGMLYPSLIFVICLVLCLYSVKWNKCCIKKRQEEVATVTASSYQLRAVEDKLPNLNSNQVVQSDNLAEPPTYMESINV
ncbi:uncharacterized protein [Oscarella lobularis]|uniref:uncharacterized protein isoform X1 n=1 Tax=Oscarella lobularis TaxID=121494 RepID=UPI003313647F